MEVDFMKLIDVISIIVDNSFINILDLEENVIAKYDGKNSVPKELNYNEVLEMYIDNNVLNIVIVTE